MDHCVMRGMASLDIPVPARGGLSVFCSSTWLAILTTLGSPSDEPLATTQLLVSCAVTPGNT